MDGYQAEHPVTLPQIRSIADGFEFVLRQLVAFDGLRRDGA